MKNSLTASLCLLTTALIWGSGFVAQKMGMDNMGPFFFTAIRMFFGGTALVLIYLIGQSRARRKAASLEKGEEEARAPEISHEERRRQSFRGGMVCGVVLYIALITQQISIVTSSAGKVAFITALYVLLVPLMGIFLHHPIPKQVWGGVFLAVLGLYFLCITESFTIAPADSIAMFSSLFWGLHIICLGHFAPKADASLIICVQCFTTGIIGLVFAIFLEDLSWASFVATSPALLWAGVMGTGIAYLFQALGQKGCSPTVASLILSLESVFAALAGYLILHEILSGREFLGCGLMFAAIVLAQLPSRQTKTEDAG